VHNVRKDGRTFWCQASISVYDHPQFGRVGVSVHEDITEQKDKGRATHERRKEMDELQKLHVAAQTASAIAHEINQPLLAIASYSEAALLMLKTDQPDCAKIRTAIEGSERQAHRAGQSIRELLDFLNSNEFPIEDFDLKHEISLLIEDAMLEHEWLFQSVLQVEEKLPRVRANRTHVQKALFNLLRNGIEAASRQPGAAKPVIGFSVRKTWDGNFAEVTVRDNGPGLTVESADHLFEPFYSTKQGGFGMGLSISRSLIEMNGGELVAVPHEGPGAIFRLTIPFANAA
jgi:signal transduction histidine kinase